MKLRNIRMGICLFVVVIAFLLSAGCIFQPSGNTAPVQQPVATQSPAATMSTTANAVPPTTVAVNGTPDPWANFVSPTETPTTNVTETAISETPTPGSTTMPTLSSVTEQATQTGGTIPELIAPTPVPTIPFVNDTCSNIGGNDCLGTETCSGAYIRTRDVPKCCAGVCQ